MAITQGTVECLRLADGFGFLGVRTSPVRLEAFILWFGSTRSDGPIALWVPELSIALARGLRVSITHSAASAFIDAVEIHA